MDVKEGTAYMVRHDRREPDGILSINGYADALKKLPPIAVICGIVIYLVYMLATAIPAKLDAHAAETQKQLRMLQQICVNTAPTPEARGTCWSLDR